MGIGFEGVGVERLERPLVDAVGSSDRFVEGDGDDCLITGVP